MEFSDLGEQCRICQERDFLPIKCVDCNFYFCKDHHLKQSHDCTKKSIPTNSNNYIKSNEKNERCNVKKCRGNMIYGYDCNECNNRYCLIHRHHFEHQNLDCRNNQINSAINVNHSTRLQQSNDYSKKNKKCIIL